MQQDLHSAVRRSAEHRAEKDESARAVDQQIEVIEEHDVERVARIRRREADGMGGGDRELRRMAERAVISRKVLKQMEAEYRELELLDDALEHDLQEAQIMCSEAMADRREREDMMEELSIFIKETRASIGEVSARGRELQDRLYGRQPPTHRSRKPASPQARARGGVRHRQRAFKSAFGVDGSERSIGSGGGQVAHEPSDGRAAATAACRPIGVYARESCRSDGNK